MYCKTHSCCIRGIEADLINVEIDVSKGVPAFNIVGLADRSINEAKERISVALRACDFELAPQRILVNLSPAHIKKEGVHFDLAIAAGLMLNFEYLKISTKLLEECVFFGELSLEGELKSCNDLLILSLSKNITQKYFIVPRINIKEAQIIQKVYGDKKKVLLADNLHDLKIILETLQNLYSADESLKKNYKKIIEHFCVLSTQEGYQSQKNKLDFADVLGQSLAKRAFEISITGNHHLLMIGPPGCGKTMLANRFINLLPRLSLKQAIETTKIHNAHGLCTNGLIEEAPLRKPHHSLSTAAFVGGGHGKVKPGEISLAHNGVLFLDEMTEFSKFTLEQLRQVLEEKVISIARIKESQIYPADFLLLAACNPCPCGYLGDKETNCRCSQMQIEKYLGKLSGPLLDRIDIHLRLNKLDADTLKQLGKMNKKSYGTKEMLARINSARDFIKKNHKQVNLTLEKEEEDFMETASYNLKLSARSHIKILKLARTIASLDQSLKIKIQHLKEALQYRAINWANYN